MKRTSKDICKLFSKKFSIDVAEGQCNFFIFNFLLLFSFQFKVFILFFVLGGKVKKHSKNEFNFESTTARVQNLSYFDQHVVTWQCSMTVLEMISSFASGLSILPSFNTSIFVHFLHFSTILLTFHIIKLHNFK